MICSNQKQAYIHTIQNYTCTQKQSCQAMTRHDTNQPTSILCSTNTACFSLSLIIFLFFSFLFSFLVFTCVCTTCVCLYCRF